MTEKENTVTKKRRARNFALFFSLLALAFLLWRASSAARHARLALSLIGSTLIPSLFPFMVISEVLQKCGFVSAVGSLFAVPMRRLFDTSGDGGGAIILGMLCGFPIGAKCAAALYDEGKISITELERLMAISSIPSAAFCISTVGASLLGSAGLGIALYISSLFSAFLVGAVDARLARKKKGVSAKKEKAAKASPINDIGISELVFAVSSSAVGVIRISGFVLFFSVFLGVISELSFIDSLSGAAVGLFFSIFELTSGVARVAVCGNSEATLVLLSFALGWSSLSIHFQIMSVTDGRGASFSRYLVLKLFQGIISAALTFIISVFFPITIKKTSLAIFTSGIPSTLSSVICALFLLSLAFAIAKKIKSC